MYGKGAASVATSVILFLNVFNHDYSTTYYNSYDSE